MCRYPWPVLRPLVFFQLDLVLQEMDAEGRVEVGPSIPVPGYDSLDALRDRLHVLLDAFTDGAPFTLQRLAELLLEPQKQYTRLHKLVSTSASTVDYAFPRVWLVSPLLYFGAYEMEARWSIFRSLPCRQPCFVLWCALPRSDSPPSLTPPALSLSPKSRKGPIALTHMRHIRKRASRAISLVEPRTSTSRATSDVEPKKAGLLGCGISPLAPGAARSPGGCGQGLPHGALDVGASSLVLHRWRGGEGVTSRLKMWRPVEGEGKLWRHAFKCDTPLKGREMSGVLPPHVTSGEMRLLLR